MAEPTLGSLALSSSAPTIAITLVGSVGSLAVSSAAPVLNVTLVGSVGSLAVSGVAPTVNTVIPASAGSLSLSSAAALPIYNEYVFGTAITNSGATTDDGKVEICDRSGWKAKRGQLIETHDGLWVLPQFYEPRNMQDFVRTRPERLTGSIRPESDAFIDDLYPNGVTRDDL